MATSSTFQSGWSSGTIDNTSNLFLDYLVGGNLYTGTSPTDLKEIRVYTYAALVDLSGTPTWPDLFSSGTEGTEGAVTLHDTENIDSGLILLWSSAIDTTTDGSYPIPPRSIRAAYGEIPQKFSIYVTHNTGVNLKSTLQALYHCPVYQQYTG